MILFHGIEGLQITADETLKQVNAIEYDGVESKENEDQEGSEHIELLKRGFGTQDEEGRLKEMCSASKDIGVEGKRRGRQKRRNE